METERSAPARTLVPQAAAAASLISRGAASAPRAMSLSTHDFWRLAHQAGLLSADATRRLHHEFQEQAAGKDDRARSAEAAASWLVDAGRLTRYQARTLLAGRAGPFLFGDYVIREPIRDGRFAGLVRARHVATGYDVLLAFCDKQFAGEPARVQAWQQEIEAASHTISPRLSRTYQVVAAKRSFAISEELHGATAAERLERGATFAPAEACRVAREVALAAATLHAAGRTHGKIAPGNVWLDDFGGVKLLQSPLLPYEPDRQSDAADTPRGVETDIRGVGRLLAQILLPRSGASNDRELLARAQAGMPPALAQLVEYLLTDAAARRYQTAAMAADALSTFVVNESRPILPAPPSPARLAYEAALAGREASIDDAPTPVAPAPAATRADQQPPEFVPPPVIATEEHDVVKFRARAGRTTSSRRQRGNLVLLATLVGVIACGAVVGFYVWRDLAVPAATGSATAAATPPASTRTPDQPSANAANPNGDAPAHGSIPLDNGNVWQSPTAGEPLDLAWLASGCQMFVAWRPADFLSHAEGEKTVDALGSLARKTRDEVAKLVGVPWRQVEELVVGFLPHESGRPRYSLFVRTRDPWAQSELVKAWGETTTRSVADQTVHEAAGYAYYVPVDQERVFVVAPTDRIEEIITSAGAPPALRREFEELLAATDRSRHLSLLLSPHFLFTDGRELLSEGAERLRQPLAQMFGDNTAGVSASVHLAGDNLFTEVRVQSATPASPDGLERVWRERVGTWPAQTRSSVESLAPSTYSAPILERFPAMVEAFDRFTRSGVDEHGPVLRTFLPAVAAHNLALGTQLALIERQGAGVSPGETPAMAEQPVSVAAQLAQVTSLSFPRNTLEQALIQLGESVGIVIVIEGGDLQLEGITKNQSFGLDERERPAREILAKILQLANADGKLVYVIRAQEDGSGEALHITTRAAVARRGEKLPPEFDKPADGA